MVFLWLLGYNKLCDTFVDPAFGFAVGWNYLTKYLIAPASKHHTLGAVLGDVDRFGFLTRHNNLISHLLLCYLPTPPAVSVSFTGTMTRISFEKIGCVKLHVLVWARASPGN
jgi:hypothetical protein